jgi:serine/threonine-protein kinase
MSRFLRFVVESSLSGKHGELKEYLIGVEVFDRKASYDPRVDPIVRVEARRLRSKLELFYESDGAVDDLILELPKGSYAPRFRHRNAAAAPQPAAPREPATTIAVLPFTNAGDDPENEYFSDGLTHELIHALTKIEELRVVAWNSAVQLKGSACDVYAIGRQLRVGSLLMGSVRRTSGRLRIRVQLVDTTNGYYLWSEDFDRELSDLFVIQEEIACAISRTLKIRLLRGIASQYNLEAYNLYLKGRYEAHKRTPEGFRRSIQFFREAIGRDENFALGWAGLADSYALLADYGISAPSEVMEHARAAAFRALEINPTLAEAETSLASIRSLYDWDWDAGRRHYRRAMELNPGYAPAFHWYAIDFLALLGKFDEAMHYLDRALEMDPLSNIIREGRPYVLMLLGRYEEALAHSREGAAIDPFFYKSYTGMGRTYIQMGRYQEAIEMFEKGHALVGDVPNIVSALGQAHALAGNKEEARRLLAQLTEIARSRYVSSTCFAILHIGLREYDLALDHLEKGSVRRDLPLCALKVHRVYDPLRGKPRLTALLQKLGLEG